MPSLKKVKSVLPVSSRSAHAMHRDVKDLQKKLNALAQKVENMDSRMMLMMWESLRDDGEDLAHTKRRVLSNLSPATGNLRLYQLAAAQLMFEFDAFCAAHGLTYWLVSGTLLGAVRHKGFIPWDDDLDVGMTRSDVEKIIELAALDDRYRVTVLYDFCAHCRQVRFRYAEEAVPCFIDLFYFDPVCSLDDATFEEREAERAALQADLRADGGLSFWTRANQNVDDRTPEGAAIRRHFDWHVSRLYEKGFLTRSLDEAEGVIWGVDNVNSGVKHHTWYLIPKEAIFPTGKVTFEGHELSAPADPDRCLSDIFGDIYELPDKLGSEFKHFSHKILADKDVRDALRQFAKNESEEG